jgi:hypothetical protein
MRRATRAAAYFDAVFLIEACLTEASAGKRDGAGRSDRPRRRRRSDKSLRTPGSVEQAQRQSDAGKTDATALRHEEDFFLKRRFKWINFEFTARD